MEYIVRNMLDRELNTLYYYRNRSVYTKRPEESPFTCGDWPYWVSSRDSNFSKKAIKLVVKRAL